jgi:hypothetical protein
MLEAPCVQESVGSDAGDGSGPVGIEDWLLVCQQLMQLLLTSGCVSRMPARIRGVGRGG